MVPTNLVCSRQNLMCAASQGRVATSRLFHLNCLPPTAISTIRHFTQLYSFLNCALLCSGCHCFGDPTYSTQQTHIVLHSTLLYSELHTSLFWMQLYCSEPYGELRAALRKLTTLFFTRLAPSPTNSSVASIGTFDEHGLPRTNHSKRFCM